MGWPCYLLRCVPPDRHIVSQDETSKASVSSPLGTCQLPASVTGANMIDCIAGEGTETYLYEKCPVWATRTNRVGKSSHAKCGGWEGKSKGVVFSFWRLADKQMIGAVVCT